MFTHFLRSSLLVLFCSASALSEEASRMEKDVLLRYFNMGLVPQNIDVDGGANGKAVLDARTNDVNVAVSQHGWFSIQGSPCPTNTLLETLVRMSASQPRPRVFVWIDRRCTDHTHDVVGDFLRNAGLETVYCVGVGGEDTAFVASPWNVESSASQGKRDVLAEDVDFKTVNAHPSLPPPRAKTNDTSASGGNGVSPKGGHRGRSESAD